MGKYLQDLMYRVDDRNLLQKEAHNQCRLIVDLFNLYLPAKIEVGGNIWRFIVCLTAGKALDGTTEEVGSCQDSYVFLDSDELAEIDSFKRKEKLLELFVKGLRLCCHISDYPFDIFSTIENRIVADGIVFNAFYKEVKNSPDKKYSAQMTGFLSEENKELSVTVFDKNGSIMKKILIGNFDFRHFDKLKWVSNSLINVYQINFTQSYKRKKVAEDYYSVNIESGAVVYVPVTRECVFDYGVKLLTETDQFDSALKFIR